MSFGRGKMNNLSLKHQKEIMPLNKLRQPAEITEKNALRVICSYHTKELLAGLQNVS